MKNLKKFVWTVDKILSNKALIFVAFTISMFVLFALIISCKSPLNFAMEEFLRITPSKFIIAIPFCFFHIIQMVVYKRHSNYAGIDSPPNIFGWPTIIISWLTYSAGVGLIFLLPLGIKCIHLYTSHSVVDDKERKPLKYWWLWDIVAVFTVSLTSYLIPEDYHFVMKDILGY